MPQPNSSIVQQSKILEFDVLRSLAILLLIFHHGGIYNFSVFGFSLSHLSTYISLFLLGSFVFLSGYLSVHSLDRHSLRTYLSSKIIRIYFPYIIAFVLFLSLLDLDVDRTDIAIHLLGAQMVLSPKLTTPVLTLWFVGMILIYYVLFGILVKTFKKTPYLVFATLIVFAGAAVLRVDHGFFARRFFYYYFVYAAGVFLARTNLINRLTTSRFHILDVMGLALIGTLLLVPFEDQVGEEVSIPLVLAITMYILAMVIFTLSIARGLVRSQTNIQIFSFLSTASFFAYLFHRPIWDIALTIYQPGTVPQTAIYQIVLGFIVVLPLSYLFQQGYNRAAAVLQKSRRSGISRKAKL